MTLPRVVYEKRSAAAWLRLNRPDELNALDPAMIEAVGDALNVAEGDREVVSIVITGAGRGFCAGADLKYIHDLAEGDRPRATARLVASLSDLTNRLERFPKPVIAAVNGIAAGGGMELVLACDLVYAAEGARLGDGHANYAQFPGAGGTVRLPRKVGRTMAKRLFFTGDLLPARQFEGTGLLTGVVAGDRLVAEVESMTARIGGKSPLYLARVKRLADEAMELGLAEALAAELAMNEAHGTSEDCIEGIAAFTQKRAPVFTGC